MAYRHYLKSLHWQATKLLMAGKKNNKCVFCKSSKNIHVHHLHYKTVGQENSKDLKNLCKECHSFWHEKFGKRYISDKTIGNIRKLFKAGFPREDAILLGAKGKNISDIILSNNCYKK